MGKRWLFEIGVSEVGSGSFSSYTTTNLDANDNSYRFAGGDYKITENYIELYDEVYGDLIKWYCDGNETSFDGWCNSDSYFSLEYDLSQRQYSNINEAIEQAIDGGYLDFLFRHLRHNYLLLWASFSWVLFHCYNHYQ